MAEVSGPVAACPRGDVRSASRPGPPCWRRILSRSVLTAAASGLLSGFYVTAAAQRRGDADSEPWRIEASVSGPAGPIVGATVTTTLSEPSSPDGKATDLSGGRVVRETVCLTDDGGTYYIDIPAHLAGRADVKLAVAVTHEDHVPRTIGPIPVTDFDMRRIGDSEPYWLHRQLARKAMLKTRLRKGNRLDGRVLLPDGSPAAGANVLMRTKYQAYSWKFHSPDDYTSSASAVADEQGRFCLLADQRATLVVTMPGQAALIVDDLAKYAVTPPNTFRLPRAIRPHGRVLTADGEPIPGAVIRAIRHFEWSEFDMPVSFQKWCVAGKDGRYVLPPLPPGAFRFRVNSRVSDISRVQECNDAAARAAGPPHPLPPLNDVILDVTKEFDGAAQEPVCDLRAVETVTVTAKIEFPDGDRPKDGRTVDLTVTGRIGGERWSGVSATADETGMARLSVPRGTQEAVIGTGLARHRRTADAPLEIGTAIHLGTVTHDISGLVVIRPALAKLDAEILFPNGVAREITKSGARIRISAWHVEPGYRERGGDKQRVWLQNTMQTGDTRFRGKALPNEEIALQVALYEGGEKSVLREERLSLDPGEERLLLVRVPPPW